MKRRNFLKIVSFGGALTVASKMTLDAFSGNADSNAKSGKRWAMVIDTRKCIEQGSGCTKCMDACNKVHNIPLFEDKKDEIKWIWKEKYEYAFNTSENRFLPGDINDKKIPLLCNHCENPPCVNVCPTQATWKREDGIVMMDWHRCIGCRYCIAACPYGSRSFNWRDPRPALDKINKSFPTRMKGVVEKCTFCDERIARGQVPACVEVCDAGAMHFGDLNNPESEIRNILSNNFSIRRKPELTTGPEVYYIV